MHMALPPDQFPGGGGSSMFRRKDGAGLGVRISEADFPFWRQYPAYCSASLLLNVYSRLDSGSRQCSASSSSVRQLFHSVIHYCFQKLDLVFHLSYEETSPLYYIIDTTSQRQGHWQATVMSFQGLRAPSLDEIWKKLCRLRIKKQNLTEVCLGCSNTIHELGSLYLCLSWV